MLKRYCWSVIVGRGSVQREWIGMLVVVGRLVNKGYGLLNQMELKIGRNQIEAARMEWKEGLGGRECRVLGGEVGVG